jgi:hypothetical protein
MKKIIHVNRHNIATNKRRGDSDQPVFTVKTYKSNNRGNAVKLLDSDGNVVATFVYRPDKPLSCGAVAWLETNLDVAVVEADGTDGLEVIV